MQHTDKQHNRAKLIKLCDWSGRIHTGGVCRHDKMD